MLSRLAISYHTLSQLIPQVESKTIFFGNFKISSQSPNFLSHLIMPCHILSHLITPYPLGWKQNRLHLATLKLGPSPLTSYHMLSRLVTSYHTLSHLIPQVGSKTIFIWQLFNQFSGPNFVITSYHALSLLITPYHTLSPRLERNHFQLAILKLVPRIMFLSHFALGIENSFPNRITLMSF